MEPLTGVQQGYCELVIRCIRERDPEVRDRIRERLAEFHQAMLDDQAAGVTPARGGRRHQERAAGQPRCPRSVGKLALDLGLLMA